MELSGLTITSVSVKSKSLLDGLHFSREGGRDHRNFGFKASKLVLLDNQHVSFAFEPILKNLGDRALAQTFNLG